MKSSIGGLFLILTLTLGVGSATASVIDDFSQGAVSMQVTNYIGRTLVQTGLDPSAVIGGTRRIYAGSVQWATCDVDTATGQFQFNAASSFGYFTLHYGAVTPLGADLTADGSDRFAITISELPSAPWGPGVAFSVQTGGTWHRYSLYTDLLGLNGPGVLMIPYTRFVGADLTRVQGIAVDAVRFVASSPIAFDSITTVPEPSALALFLGALGVVAVALRRGRRM